MGVKPKKALEKKPKRASAPPSQGSQTNAPEPTRAPIAFSRAIIDALGNACVILRQDTLRILAANHAAGTLYGQSTDQLETMDLPGLSFPGQEDSLRVKLASPKAKKELQQRGQDGSRITVETTPTAGTFAGEPAWLCVLHEISSRASLVQALLESDATNREIIENASDIIYTHDLVGNFTSGNKAVAKILGYSRSETLNMNIRDVVIPEDQEKAKQATLA